MIDLQKIRENFADTNRGKTHYEGCEYAHPLCAIRVLLREVEGMRRERDKAVADIQWMVTNAAHEKLDGYRELGHRAAAAEERAEKAEREVERLRGKEVGCERNDGTLNVHRESETCEVCEPDWLPAPDTMPADLAPAQMVELHGWEGNRVPARKVAWEVVSKYRLLYSDSGEVICSADDLEEWAQFVATDGDGQVWQYECVPEEDDGLWEQVMGSANPAPSTHRKPGPWIESLMEVTRR